LVAELRSRGIEQELAVSVVGRLVDDEGQEELARRLLKSFLASRDRAGSVAGNPAAGDGVAAARYLVRRGFDEDLVARLVEPLLAEQFEDPADPHG
jgi:SOS response regulatory protein OraA/RecX